jgi:hypothetical protein
MYQGEENADIILNCCSIEMAGLVECVESIRSGTCPILKGARARHYRCDDVFRKVSLIEKRRKIACPLLKRVIWSWRSVRSFLKK